MSLRRRDLNILLVILVISLGGVAAWIYRLPHLVLYSLEKQEGVEGNSSSEENDSIMPVNASLSELNDTSSLNSETSDMIVSTVASSQPMGEEAMGNQSKNDIMSARFAETDISKMIAGHPFSKEARKILEGNLDERDSLSRHQILDYCEHLRKSYTTKDIDFLRQFYSDDALIIVGHVVKKGNSKANIGYGDKVSYSIHSKKSYLERIARVFASNKSIKIDFSDFKILRHPTVKGIYGVTLRQKYKNDSYSDDGYLFLLWDFRNASAPQIHVRTWQPKSSINQEEDRIDMSDFNLE